MVLEMIGNIIISIVNILAFNKMMDVFFEERRTPFAVLLSSYVPLLLYGVFIDAAAAMIGVLFMALSIFIITLNYKSSMLKRVIAVVYLFIMYESVIAIMSNFFVGNLPLFGNISQDTVLYMLASLVFYVLVILMFKYFKYIRKNIFDFRAFFSLILVIAATYVATALYITTDISRTAYFNLYTIFLAGSTFLVFFQYNALSKAHVEKLKSTLHAQEKEYYSTQCQLMQESTEQVKSIRHDMVIHLSTLRDYSLKNKTGEITDYLNRLLGDVGESELYSGTGNLAFDSIINFKLKNAKADDIKLDIRMLIPSVLNVDVTDVVTILGNLLDNALDAVAKVEGKEIKLDIEFAKGCLFIKLDNSFNGEIKYSDEKVGEKRQLASLKNEKGHGYGLKNIRQSVEKYNGHLKISYSESVFSVGILLCVDENF